MIRLSRFQKDVSKLAGGTAMSQVISIAALPVLTRIYSTAEFGVFVVFQSVATVLAVLATGRYEFSALSATTDEQAAASTWLVFAIASMSSLVIATVGVSTYAIAGLSWDESYHWSITLLLAAFVLVNAAYQGLYAWLNRHERYSELALNQIVRAIAVAAISIGLGLAGFGGSGLIVGAIAGQSINFGLLLRQVRRRQELPFPGFAAIRARAIERADFPKYMIPSGIVERLSSQLHILILSSLFGPSVAGGLGLYKRVVSMPGRIIGQSIRHVFRQRAANLLAESGQCARLFNRTLVKLTVIGLPVAILLFVTSPTVFPWVFGQEWSQAGEFSRWLAPMFLLGFIVSPLSSLIVVGEQPKYDLWLQLFFLGLSLPCILVGALISGPLLAVFLYGIAYCVKSVVELLLSRRIAYGTPLRT